MLHLHIIDIEICFRSAQVRDEVIGSDESETLITGMRHSALIIFSLREEESINKSFNQILHFNIIHFLIGA